MKVFTLLLALLGLALEARAWAVDPQVVLGGLREFYQKTARADGSFQPGIDPNYLGMSDSAYSDLAAVTYACTIHKTFGWTLPHERETVEFLLSRQKPSGEFVNTGGTVDPQSPQGRTYNTTQALVALRALGVKPRFNPLPVFEEILKQDYKTLPAYSTSFFPLAYLCAGQPIPPQADRAIRALMIQDRDGYLNDHIAATFHASHYYALVGEATPKSHRMIERIVADQNRDGSWFLNLPSRDRHATFDAVFTLLHEGNDRQECRTAIQRAAEWAMSCRNPDGGFGHFPGSPSDADAVYFQAGTLVMAGILEPVKPLPADPHLLSWGHLMPVQSRGKNNPLRIPMSGWVGSVTFSHDGQTLATGDSKNHVQLWDPHNGKLLGSLSGHHDDVVSVSYAPDGRSLATGSYDQTAKIWDAEARGVRHTLVGHRGAVLGVAYSPDGKTLATSGIDATVRLWNTQSAEPQRLLEGHKSWVNSVAFSPDGQSLLSGSSDGTVKIWSVSSGELVKTLIATNAEVRSIAISPDAKLVAAGIRYGTVKIWNTADWHEQRTWEAAADDVWSLAFSADSQRIYAAAGEWNRPTTITVRNVRTGELEPSLKHTGEVLSIAISRDGKFLAAGGGDQSVGIWNIDQDTKR